MQASDKTHRIAKNTIILYIRMIVMIFIGLFTSRVILNTLGVENYGIYNVVGLSPSNWEQTTLNA